MPDRLQANRETGDDLESLTLARRSTADQVADLLREHIVAGRLRPGVPLREAALAGSLGVARNTLREGIRVLIGEGLLRYNMHHGVVVGAPTPVDVRDIYRTRRLIETAAALQGDHAATGALGRMEQSVADLQDAVETRDWHGTVAADFEFHTRLVESLGMHRLASFHAAAMRELRLALFLLDSSADDPSLWAPQHDDICRLLRAGQRTDAARVVEQHLTECEDRVAGVVATILRISDAAAG
jgi:DNA-binding GntR family transcriptional regulator